ncbi:MAG: phytanoyl-CoA dioxygenase family protein [Candidatus Poribacteria bacterium]|nr:phytanoyl-CoA dioxygenase family protein [Candidatus Poribacteria bacterium]
MQSFLDSTSIVDNGPELRNRVKQDGYLFIRGLLPTDMLESLRMQWLEIARQAGWVKTDAPLEDAIVDLNGFCVEPEPRYMQVYHNMYKLPEFHALQHHPNLIGLFERMLDEPVMPHPRIIGRTIFPQREAFTTPPHQDFIPIQGTAETYTAWIPLTDVPPELGGLQVAAGSHRHGVYDFRPALGAGGTEVIDPLEGAWVNNPFRQGDVLIFHSMIVHKGLPNTADWLRMSIDSRYQKISDPVAPGSLQPHSQPSTWEEIYVDWPPNGLQHYWHKWALEVKAYDNRYHEKRDRLALEMAANGDPRAFSALQRIIARDTDAAKRKKAADLLAMLEEPR